VYRLFSLAQWNQARAGDTLVQQDMQLDSLMLINRGEATVQVKNDKVAKLGEGHFVGEMSYITGDKTSATVIADSDLEYVTWPTSTLEPLLIKYPDLRIALNAIIGVDLAGKLSRI
jgi:CRP-like cAMP-binding protein